MPAFYVLHRVGFLLPNAHTVMILSVVLATLLTLALFIVTSIVSARRTPSEPAPPAGPHIALLPISNCQLPILKKQLAIGNWQLEIDDEFHT